MSSGRPHIAARGASIRIIWAKRFECQRLRAVGQRVRRIGMYLDDQPVGANCDRGGSERAARDPRDLRRDSGRRSPGDASPA